MGHDPAKGHEPAGSWPFDGACQRAGADELGLVTGRPGLVVPGRFVVVVEHARLVEAVLAGEDARRLVAVDLADPGADEDGRDALPAKFVSARASLMRRSMPTMKPTPGTRSGRCDWRPPARVARPAPLTPAAPLLAMIMKTRSEICSPMLNGLSMASAMKRLAIVR